MQAIRCPHCGLTNYPDDISYPRCGQCHEDLVRCDNCRHFQESACHHPRAIAHFTADLEAAKHCPEFRSRHLVRGSRMLWQIPAPVWVATLLVFLLIGLFTAAWFIDPDGRYFRGNPIWPETVVPSQAIVGQPFWVTMRLTNLLDHASTRIYIEIDGDFLGRVEPMMPLPMPEPTRMDRDRDRLLLEYEPLPSHGQMLLQLPFVPRQAGVTPFIAKIYAPSNQLRHKVNVPITILPQPTALRM